MGTGMKRISALFIGLLFTFSSVATAQDLSREAKKAKAYVAEVEKHLLESYVDRAKMTEEGLNEVGLEGLESGLKKEAFSELPSEIRAEIIAMIQASETVADAIEGVDQIIGDEDFEFLLFADGATNSMVKSTGDPFSKILTQKEFNKLLSTLRGGSKKLLLGVSVRAKDGEVMYVQYGYPAYEAGMEIGDRILKVDGKSIKGKSQTELNDMLKLKEGAIRKVLVKKKGHKKNYLFKIRPFSSEPENVKIKYLGRGVGYMRIGMFDLNLAKEVKSGLEDLKEQGMEAFILDLRNNPGGALPAATAVADLFLPHGLLITETKSNYKPNLFGMKLPGAGGDQTFETKKKKSEFEEMPMVVLINHASASASELLSGALQDHKRALLIGEKTYGKGVGQSPVMLSSVMMKRFLYLTVMEYTLPTGRSIHHKGVSPDIVYSTKKPSAEDFAARWEIRGNGQLEKWLDRTWDRYQDKYKELAEYDGFDSGNYPAFKRFYSSLNTTLDPDLVRAELRRAIRSRVSQEEKRSWVADLETDVQLQRGLVGVLEKMEQ